jgi:two-component system response regulator GlrR
MASILNLAAVARAAEAAQGEAASWRAEIVARSEAMESLLAQARRAAASDVAVCIVGPAGAGKETLARAIHRASPRAAGPFVVVRCSAATEDEIRRVMLGSPGADGTQAGFAPAAAGGTLYLDGASELSPALQAGLQQALEERAPGPAGARLISGTRERLEERVAAGAFREDLFFRLGVIRLVVPALADRREDIPLLVGHALARLAARYKKARPAIADDALELLVAAPWPGNVRQLLAIVEQLVATAPGGAITRAMVEQALGEAPRFVTLDEARRAFERDYLVRVLKITRGNVTRAARLAGRNRTEFYRLLARHALAPAMFKSGARAAHANPPAAGESGRDPETERSSG